ncbi:MAG TPA: putative metallopeptidase [Bdellovibrionota bacterium]|nr:putative metallopeptidase [Bdellovibrionota bacterium]
MRLLRLLVIIGAIFAVTACGKQPTLQLNEFATYVDMFQEEAASHGQPVKVTDLIVRFGTMENPYERGICEIAGDETPVITINQEAWDQMSEDEREPLMFHELGHCVLRRKHRADQIGPGVPASLMNPYTIAGWTYGQYKKHYIDELFSQHNTL